MKSLTVRLPGSLLTEIEHQARTRRISKSDVVRERLQQPRATESDSNARVLLAEILETSWANSSHQPRRHSSSRKQRLTALIRAKKLHR